MRDSLSIATPSHCHSITLPLHHTPRCAHTHTHTQTNSQTHTHTHLPFSLPPSLTSPPPPPPPPPPPFPPPSCPLTFFPPSWTLALSPPPRTAGLMGALEMTVDAFINCRDCTAGPPPTPPLNPLLCTVSKRKQKIRGSSECMHTFCCL